MFVFVWKVKEFKGFNQRQQQPQLFHSQPRGQPAQPFLARELPRQRPIQFEAPRQTFDSLDDNFARRRGEIREFRGFQDVNLAELTANANLQFGARRNSQPQEVYIGEFSDNVEKKASSQS